MIWNQHDSGLVVPEGTVSDLSVSESNTYLEIKEKAIALEELYCHANLALPVHCDLAVLISDAKTLSDAWLTGRASDIPTTLLFRVALLHRIATAVLPLREMPDRSNFLRELSAGGLDLLERKQSRAKNLLWELELWAILKRRCFEATLEEPPDIVVHFDHAKIGIACKKLYSERHVQNVLSEAVAQVESAFDFGIVAINLDDLVPANQILRMPTHDTVAQRINELNGLFLERHERHFRKYLSSGRLVSAFISTALLADIYNAQPRFNDVRQSTIWTIPGLGPEKARALKSFYDGLMG
jgi:hypothetical protein